MDSYPVNIFMFIESNHAFRTLLTITSLFVTVVALVVVGSKIDDRIISSKLSNHSVMVEPQVPLQIIEDVIQNQPRLHIEPSDVDRNGSLPSIGDENETNYSMSNGNVLLANETLPSSGLIQHELKKVVNADAQKSVTSDEY